MENAAINSRGEFLDRVNLENKVVLDAGTGGWSARFLAQKRPERIVCVAAPGDIRKEEEARNALQSADYKNYQIILENLVCEDLFPQNSFDFILADYLLEEVDAFAPLRVCEVFHNFYRYLRQGGEIVIVNPEAYIPFCPEYELRSTLGVQGDAQLGKRSNRDLIDALYLLLSTSLTLKLLFPLIGVHYLSKWICDWLIEAGFQELETYSFDIKVYTATEFTKRSAFTRRIISTIDPPKLRDGLIQKLEEVILEYKHRNVTEDDFFLQRHYIIYAKKGETQRTRE